MSKYFAVVKDSFREALASRVLWLVLLLITLLLLAIAPLGYQEELTWRIRDNDVRNWPKLMDEVRIAGKEDEQKTPAARIWQLLDPAHQQRLATVDLPGRGADPPNPFTFISVSQEFRKEINTALERDDFYDESYFPDMRMLSSELRQLREAGLGALSETEIARFNRLILEASFPELVRASSPTSIQLLYATFQVGGSFPLRGESLRNALESVVSTGLNWFVGAIGILIAILVTAPIIPQMFDPGSLHLLLSKPVSRSLLFLAKFFGGCAFILIAVAKQITGIWLVLGFRFAIWDASLLWSVPIYLFVFAIYYSVAAFVGAIWRSPIVVVALTILFWCSCFVIGWSKVAFESAFWNKSRLIQILEADDDLLVVNEAGFVHRWDSAESTWVEIFVSPDQRQASGFMMFMPTIPREMRPVGPIYDPAHDRLLAVHPSFPPRPPIEQHLYVGERADDWDAISNLNAPTGTLGIFRDSQGGLLTASSLGIFRLTGDPLQVQEPVKLFGFKIPLSLGGPFKDVSPDPPLLLTQPANVAFDSTSGRLLAFTRATATMLIPSNDGRFAVTLEVKLDGDEQQPAVVGLAGETIAIGREDGRLQFYDAGNGELREEFQPHGGNQPRFIVAAPDGSLFAVVFHNGQLSLYDTQAGHLSSPQVAGQGDISAAYFSSNATLFVADQTLRVSHYAVSEMKLLDRFSPQLGLLERGYRYGLVPLYTLFPKPGELNKTIQFILSGEETEAIDQDDLASAQREIDPWSPVWSSALFVVVMLVVSCIYIERQDF